MKNELSRFEIYVDGKLRFIKNNLRDKDNILKLLKEKSIDFEVKQIKFY
jgi:hypothetical protein